MDENRIKVLFFSHSVQVHGAETCLINLLCNLDRVKFEPVVVLPREGSLKQVTDSMGIRSYVVPLEWWVDTEHGIWFSDVEFATRLEIVCDIIVREAPHIVHTNTSVICEGAIAARKIGIPHVWHLHEVLEGHPSLASIIPLSFFYSAINLLSEKIVVVAESMRLGLSRVIDPQKVVTIYNGIEPARDMRGVQPQIRLELGLSGDVILGITATMLQKAKGVGNLLQAAKIVKGRADNIKFILAGEGDPVAVAELKKMIRAYDLEQTVYYIGFRPDFRQILTEADFMIIPSVIESFSLATVEAMASAKPVISTDCGGPAELIVDGETGYVVPVNDPDRLSTRILELLACKEKTKEMGAAGLKRFQENFTVEAYANKFAALYQDIVMGDNVRPVVAENNTKLEAIIEAYQSQRDKLFQLADRDRQIAELISDRDRQIADREQRIADFERQISNRDRQINDCNRQIAARDLKIQSLLTSASWKVTEPLRYVHQRLPLIKNIIPRSLQILTRSYQDNFIDQSVIQDVVVTYHCNSTDIIVCVHNALDDVMICLESILKNTQPPYSLILVDDGSSEQTATYLANFAQSQGATLIRNDEACGYTFAANQGLKAANADNVVLLNSDTVVVPDWLDRMIMCAESDPRIGIVGPLSNTASWQSIPKIEDAGDWATNPLPEGVSVSDMGNLVAAHSGRIYPRIAFLNGFCLMIKRAVLDRIGYFDEKTFARGYGEENDYCLRTRKSGWTLAVADDVYIYHAQSKSYSHERRKQLSEQATKLLVNKHGNRIIEEGVIFCKNDRVMQGLRIRASLMSPRQLLITRARTFWEGQRVLFILPITDAGGGGNIVISEATAMRRMGVDATILNLSAYRKPFEEGYPSLVVPVIYASSEEEIPDLCAGYDAIIATANRSVSWVLPLLHYEKAPVIGYYIQDFEPYFFDHDSIEYQIAWNSYSLLPNMVRFTKTLWNQEELRQQIGCDSHIVGPSCDVDLFRPRVRSGSCWPERPLRIVAMIRPESPRRNALGTMKILHEISKQFGQKIEIILFGADSKDPAFCSLPQNFRWRNIGKQTSQQLATVFNNVDIFVDFSSFQAMGLTAMEAMSCGVAVIVPNAGGASSFAEHENNALIVDTTSHAVCCEALGRLINDHDLRLRLQQNALEAIPRYYPEGAAFRILEALFPNKVVD